MKKGIIYFWRRILVVAFMLYAFAAIPAQGQQKIVFSTPIKAAVHIDLPGFAMEEQGFWKQLGLNVQWIAFETGRAQVDALAAGSVNVSFTTATEAIMVVSRGLPTVLVADTKLRNDFLVYVPANSRITKPQELKGTKMGVFLMGATSHAYGILVAKKLGLEKDIKFVGSGGTMASIAAVKTGAIDSIMTNAFSIVNLEYEKVVRSVVSVSEFLPKQWTDMVLIARRDFAAQRPSDLKKVIRGYHMATDFVMKNPDWAVEKMKTLMGYPEGAARRVLPLLNWGENWEVDPKVVKNVRDFLVEYGLVEKEKSPELEKLYTNEFVS